jgi:hypothetical protein
MKARSTFARFIAATVLAATGRLRHMSEKQGELIFRPTKKDTVKLPERRPAVRKALIPVGGNGAARLLGAGR